VYAGRHMSPTFRAAQKDKRPVDPLAAGTSIPQSSAYSKPGTVEPPHSTEYGATSPASQDHTYAEAGVYPITVTVTDDDGGAATQTYEYIVIYNPSGGFVTGGGWIWSNAGWCQLDEACAGAEGKANFGFVSKYKKGARCPPATPTSSSRPAACASSRRATTGWW
jgi:hypothetical protein